MKFDGTSWINVGTAGFSSAEADWISIAFSPSDQPYVSFTDWGDSTKATVMKFDGTQWVNVGNEGFSVGEADYTSLAFNSSGDPFVAFSDGANNYEATVMYYNVTAGIDVKQQPQLSVYPNPARDKITIGSSEIPVNGQLSILDISGKELLQQPINGQKTVIDISSLPGGVYIVKLTGSGSVQEGKLINW